MDTVRVRCVDATGSEAELKLIAGAEYFAKEGRSAALLEIDGLQWRRNRFVPVIETDTHKAKLDAQQEQTRDRALKALNAIEKRDNVRRPEHYSRWVVEPIEFIMQNGIDFATGNVIKYVMRAPFKNGVEDLKKARRYLDMMIKRAEGDKEFAK